MNKVLEGLAAYALANQMDVGGHHARAALLVAVLADRCEGDTSKLLDLVCFGGDGVREASDEVERLLRDAERADQAAKYGQAVSV